MWKNHNVITFTPIPISICNCNPYLTSHKYCNKNLSLASNDMVELNVFQSNNKIDIINDIKLLFERNSTRLPETRPPFSISDKMRDGKPMLMESFSRIRMHSAMRDMKK